MFFVVNVSAVIPVALFLIYMRGLWEGHRKREEGRGEGEGGGLTASRRRANSAALGVRRTWRSPRTRLGCCATRKRPSASITRGSRRFRAIATTRAAT